MRMIMKMSSLKNTVKTWMMTTMFDPFNKKVKATRMIMKIIPPPMIMRMSSATNVQKGSNWKRR